MRVQIANTEDPLQKAAMQVFASGDPRAQVQAVNTLRTEGYFDVSHYAAERLYRSDPDNPTYQDLVSRSYCRMGSFRKGLMLYDEARKSIESKQRYLRAYPFREWRGEELAGKKILLWAEQGVGDQIMQARCLHFILQQKPDRVVVEADPRIFPGLQQTFPSIETAIQTVPLRDELKKRQFDYQQSLMSAWAWSGHAPEDAEHASRQKPYWKYPAQLRDGFRNAWEKRAWRHNVGLSWHSKAKKIGHLKSIKPEIFQILTACEDICFHSLQYDADASTLKMLAPEFQRQLLCDAEGDATNDLHRLAAQIAAMDAVVTIDNTTAHIAGAVGTPCFVFLPRFSDWRWGVRSDRTFLYESLTLCRQESMGGWAAEVAKARLWLQDTLDL